MWQSDFSVWQDKRHFFFHNKHLSMTKVRLSSSQVVWHFPKWISVKIQYLWNLHWIQVACDWFFSSIEFIFKIRLQQQVHTRSCLYMYYPINVSSGILYSHIYSHICYDIRKLFSSNNSHCCWCHYFSHC